jgi:hypothetical protein
MGADVRWELTAVIIKPIEPHKKLVATVRATTPSLGEAHCLVEVFIGKGQAPSRGLRISARRFLLPNQTEQPDYGLYSYCSSARPHK